MQGPKCGKTSQAIMETIAPKSGRGFDSGIVPSWKMATMNAKATAGCFVLSHCDRGPCGEHHDGGDHHRTRYRASGVNLWTDGRNLSISFAEQHEFGFSFRGTGRPESSSHPSRFVSATVANTTMWHLRDHFCTRKSCMTSV